MSALTRNTELLSDMRNRTLAVDHTADQKKTAMNIQPSITVGQENLLASRDVRHLH